MILGLLEKKEKENNEEKKVSKSEKRRLAEVRKGKNAVTWSPNKSKKRPKLKAKARESGRLLRKKHNSIRNQAFQEWLIKSETLILSAALYFGWSIVSRRQSKAETVYLQLRNPEFNVQLKLRLSNHLVTLQPSKNIGGVVTKGFDFVHKRDGLTSRHYDTLFDEMALYKNDFQIPMLVSSISGLKSLQKKLGFITR